MAHQCPPGTVGADQQANSSIHQSRWSDTNQQHDLRTRSLDPLLPSYQPSSMQVQHYQPAAGQAALSQSALQTRPTAASMPEMQRRLVEMNTYHIVDIVKMTRRADQHSEEIENMKKVFQKDFQTLEQRINALSPQQVQLPKKLLETNEEDMFSKEQIAEAYLNEAEDKEACAERLREQAGLLWPPCLENASASQEAAVPADNLRPGHIICETKDALVEVLVQHVDAAKTKCERFDSAYGSPARGQAQQNSLARTYACCGHEYPEVTSLIYHVQLFHHKLLEPLHVRAKQTEPTDVKPPVHQSVTTAEKLGASDNVRFPTTSTTGWRPFAIRDLEPQPISRSAALHTATFSWSFLRDLLGGKEWSPGYFYDSSKQCILPTRGYWLVDLEHEPFMPRTPGQHGAKLTALFNTTAGLQGEVPGPENYMETPVFVTSDRSKTYRYLGHYSQTRYSDKVGYDTFKEHIPESVRHHHAEQLSLVGRPGSVTECLREHFWPKPMYTGPMPTDSACNTPKSSATAKGSSTRLERRVKHALEEYARELKEWEKIATMKANHINAEAILAAFDKEDSEAEPGLRLWWEYLQCVGYQDDFYDMLVTLQKRSTCPSIRPQPTPTLSGIKKIEASSTDKEEKSDWHGPPELRPPPFRLYGTCNKALQMKLQRQYVQAPSLLPMQWVTPSFDDDDEPNKPMEVKKPSNTPNKATPTTAMEPTPKPAPAPAPAPALVTKNDDAPTKSLPPHLAARKSARSTPAANTLPPDSTVSAVPEKTNNSESKTDLPYFAARRKSSTLTPAGPAGLNSTIASTTTIENTADITVPTYSANPFTTTGDLEAAKTFAQEATVAQGTKKVLPPHLRGK